MSPPDMYQQLLEELESFVRSNREAINAEERIFWPLEELLRAARTKVENVRGEH